MSTDPLLLQAAFAIPLVSGLVVYTLVRWDRSALHLMLAALLTSLLMWLGGSVLKLSPGPLGLRMAGLDLEIGAIVFMPTLFLMTMAYFARSSLFENSAAPALGLLTVSTVFLVVHLTDTDHRLMVADPAAALAGRPEATWAGPAFWSMQIYAVLCNAGAFWYVAKVLRRAHSPAERGRAAMILAACMLPILAHLVHLTGWLPIDYSLAPGTIALTAVFFVQGVHRYGLLGGQTIVRHDLIEHLDAGLLLADEQGTVVDANRAAEALIGTERDRMRGVPLPEVLALLEPDEASRDFGERLLALGLDGSRIDVEMHTADERILEVGGGGVPSLGAQPAGRFVSLEDRTTQRRSEGLLRERQKLESVGILAAGVAHEVNNPLAYVRANLVHLRSLVDDAAKQRGDGADPAVDEMPEVIEESIEGLDRIARIVETMLRFARTSDERLRPVDMADVVDEALRLAALQRSHSVEVVRTGGPVPPVLGNAERLVQVLLNLFLNARHALAERPDARIETEVATEGDHVVVRVRDNGPGIPEALLPRIFDPFFTTRGPDAGTGLGLSIAFDIVREHGGTLEVASRPGEGACFTVRLAAAPDEPAPTVPWKSA